MSITNTEKQARFRKKETLKRGAEQIFREWQTHPTGSHMSDGEVLGLLEKAYELPTGWTDQDYENAVKRLEQLRLDFLTNSRDLSNDVHKARSTDPETGQVRFRPGMVDQARLDTEIAHELARHLISAVKLSKATDVASAAAIMEVVRSVARDMIVSAEVSRSFATASCLAALPQYLDRPEWFVEEFADLLKDRLGNELSRKLGTALLAPKKEWS